MQATTKRNHQGEEPINKNDKQTAFIQNKTKTQIQN